MPIETDAKAVLLAPMFDATVVLPVPTKFNVPLLLVEVVMLPVKLPVPNFKIDPDPKEMVFA